ncbi:MAG: dihydropteroate synthase [Bacteroidaceae bacterium]|nr:dihydropteroate synthase [Bacteroidaceae bacterium]
MKGLLPYTLNIDGELLSLSEPQVMGILNVTPDSFYADSRKGTEAEVADRVTQILEEGGSMIDIGAYSSRPGADEVSPEEEMKRLVLGLKTIRRIAPQAIVSVDTFRSDIARMCVEEYGVQIINDISGGEMDQKMFQTVAELNVPYILTHMKGTPQTMQENATYDHLMAEMLQYFGGKVQELHGMGVKDIILDPGFGFAKTLDQNYELMNHLQDLKVLGLPLLVGVSRKSMIYRLLDSTAEESLNGTTVLNTLSLMKGANILRVHDVKACVETITIIKKMLSC